MPSLLDYYNNDFIEPWYFTRSITFQPTNYDEVIAIEKIYQHANSTVLFFAYYFPKASHKILGDLIFSLIDRSEQSKTDSVANVLPVFDVVTLGEQTKIYSKLIYVYSESMLSAQDQFKLNEICIEKKIFMVIRSTDYLKEKIKVEKPLAFISHDSNDKLLIAKPIAHGLIKRLSPVWYDEFSLKVGDNLRESIDEGIRQAKKCILILSPNYLKNSGWGKSEFDSIFTRELMFQENIILPIWYNITKEELFGYSTYLPNKVALHWPSKEDKSDEEYEVAMEILISKLHTAINA